MSKALKAGLDALRDALDRPEITHAVNEATLETSVAEALGDETLLSMVSSVVAAHDVARDPCRWTCDADSDLWTSSCGEDWTFTDGGPAEYNCKFCHGCGKPIEVTP